jgi:hypothetical protein
MNVDKLSRGPVFSDVFVQDKMGKWHKLYASRIANFVGSGITFWAYEDPDQPGVFKFVSEYTNDGLFEPTQFLLQQIEHGV